MELKKPYKIAIISPTVHYYHVPLYRRLARSPEIDLNVYYCSDEGIVGSDVKKAYGTAGRFLDDNMLNGYSSKFIKNYSPCPSYVRWPFGLINIGVWREIKNGEYDAVILQAWTNFTEWLAFFACLRFKTPVLFMTDANILSEFSNPFKKIIKNIMLKFLSKNATGFLTAGKSNEQLYLHYGASPKKITPMHFSWGYDYFLEEFKRLKSQREKIRSSFGIGKNDSVLLFVGRLMEDKGLFDFLDAYNKVGSANKKLFFVGDGPLRNRIKKYIKDLDIKGVYFYGFKSRENLSDFYTLADTLILPSGWEPWGMVVNEAMCFNLPVIISDRVGAAADLVKNNYNGFVFPIGDAKQFSLCIKKIIEMPIQQRIIFGERSNEIIKEWINGIDPVKQLIKLLSELN